MIPGPVVDDRATKGAASLCPDMAIIGWKDPQVDMLGAIQVSKLRSLVHAGRTVSFGRPDAAGNDLCCK